MSNTMYSWLSCLIERPIQKESKIKTKQFYFLEADHWFPFLAGRWLCLERNLFYFIRDCVVCAGGCLPENSKDPPRWTHSHPSFFSGEVRKPRTLLLWSPASPGMRSNRKIGNGRQFLQTWCLLTQCAAGEAGLPSSLVFFLLDPPQTVSLFSHKNFPSPSISHGDFL